MLFYYNFISYEILTSDNLIRVAAAEVPPVVVANAKLIMRSSKKNIKYEGFQVTH